MKKLVQNQNLKTNSLFHSWLKILGVILLCLSTTTGWGQVLWSSASGSAWLTGGNWTGSSVPTNAQIAQFGANPTAATGVGINFNGTTNAGVQLIGQKIQEVGAVEVTSARAAAFFIGNSSNTSGATGTFRPLGIVVNGVNNTILRNNSSQLFTIQNTQGSGSQTMGLELINATNNLINIDGTGGITISSIISGSGKNLTKTGTGAGVLQLTGANTYSGSTTISGGTLQLNRSGGATLPASNNVVITSGTLKVSSDQTLNNVDVATGATLTVDAGVTLTINGTLNLNGGTIQGLGAINVTGALSTFVWSGGTIQGTTTTIAASSTNNVINGASSKNLVSGTFINNATITWSNGTFFFGNTGTSFLNNGTFDITNDLTFSHSIGGSPTFTNSATGIISKSAGTGTATFGNNGGVVLDNSGQINILTGTMNIGATFTNISGGSVNVTAGKTINFNSGSQAFNSGSSVNAVGGAATVSFSSSTSSLVTGVTYDPTLITTINGANANWSHSGLTINNFTVIGSTLNNTGNITVSNNFDFQGGNFSGSGNFVISNMGSFSTGSAKNLNAGTLTNNGTITWSSGTIFFGNTGTSFVNNGTLDVANDNLLSHAIGGSPIFTNSSTGIITKSAGSGTAVLGNNGSVVLNNGGQINIQSGTMNIGATFTNISGGNVNVTTGKTVNFNSGSQTFNSGSSVNAVGGAATVSFSSSTSSLVTGVTYDPTLITTINGANANWSHSGLTINNFTVIGSTLNNTGNITVSNNFDFQGGNFSGSGNFVISNTGSFSTGSAKNLNAGTLTNNGTLTWSSGTIFFANTGTSFVNNGTFDIANDNLLSHNVGGTPIFTNSSTGIISKSAGAGTATFGNISNLVFNNSGQFNVQSGTVVLNASGTRAGSFNVSNGATLSSNAAFSFTGSTFTNNGTVSDNVSFTNNGTYNGSGTYNTSLFTNSSTGTVAPGNSPGCQTYSNGFTTGGTTSIEVNGTTTACTDYDKITVTGTATLGGTLDVTVGYTPANNDQVTIIDATTLSGTFTTENVPANWTVLYNTPSNGQVTLSYSGCVAPSLSSSVTNVTCPGGTDGSVDLILSGGTSPFTYLWSDGITTTEDISALSAGTYSVTVTATGGCTAQLTGISVGTTNVNPNAGTISGLSAVCEGSTITLTSNGDAGGSWSSSDALIASVNGSGVVTGEAPGGPVTITYEVSNACGTVSATKSVEVDEQPTVDASGSQTSVCKGDYLPLSSVIGGGTTSILWTTSGDGTFDDNTDPSTNYNPGVNDKLAGTATLTITTNTNACGNDVDVLVLTILPVPTVGATNNGPVCAGDPFTLDGSVSGGSGVYSSYTWTGLNNANVYTTLDVNIISSVAADDDTYELVVQDANGCSGQASTAVTVNTPATWYQDQDGDTYYGATSVVCGTPSGSGWSLVPQAGGAGDCNDNNIAIHPGATEICNTIDDDCDALVDDADPSITGQTNWFQDFDSDFFGNPSVTQLSCTQPVGYVITGNDCNDNNGAVNPGATEICNTIDDDCDGLTDDADGNVTGQATWYADADNDTYGNPNSSQLGCAQPSGYVADNTDCNDGDAGVNPGALDVSCNGVDENCSGVFDEGYVSIPCDGSDLDFCNEGMTSCVAGIVQCSDNTGDNLEVCNNVDDDCDGLTDEGVLLTFYADVDMDGYGDPNVSTQACAAPSGYVADNTDCNDGNALINPGATDASCNGIDENCSGVNDDGYVSVPCDGSDADFCNEGMTSCVGGAIVCDDMTGDNIEVCNGIDDDCNGSIDDGLVYVTYYLDADVDGFGNLSSPLSACAPPLSYVLNSTDCNDNDNTIFPGAIEVCNGVDEDCDGLTDEGVLVTFYRDFDVDGFGDVNTTTQACSVPFGFVANSTDCNDNDINIYPGATEACNTIDDDCDGFTDEGVQSTFYADADGDGYGNLNVTTQACTLPGGYVNDNTDCNDGNNLVNPGATEICNNIDDDCDALTDEGIAPFDIIASTNGNGSISPTGTVSVACGGSQLFNAFTPDPGYQLYDVIVDGMSQGVIASYTFTNVSANHTIVASYGLAGCVNPPTVFAGTDIHACETGDATLTATIGGSATTVVSWTGGVGTYVYPNFPDLSVLNYTPDVTEAGTTVTLTALTDDPDGAGPCLAASDQVDIIVDQVIAVDAGPDIHVCSVGGTVFLNGIVSGGASSGYWSGGVGTFSPNSTTLNATYVPNLSEAGTQVTLTLNPDMGLNVCPVSSDDIVITVDLEPTANAGADVSVCGTGSVQLNGSVTNATGGDWTGGLGTFSPNASTLNATYTPHASELFTTVTLTLTSTDANNVCPAAFDDVEVTVDDLIVDAGPDIHVCINGFVNLGGIVQGGPGTGTWSGGAGSFSNVNDLNAIYTPHASEAGTVVTLTLTSDGSLECPAEMNSIDITVDALAVVNAGPDINLCIDGSATLNGIISGGAMGGTWSGGLGTFSPNNTSLSVTYFPHPSEVNTIVSLTLTATMNPGSVCNVAEDFVDLIVEEIPTAYAGMDFTSCFGAPVVLNGTLGGGAVTATWSTAGDGSFDNVNLLNAAYTPGANDLSSGNVLLTLTPDATGVCVPVPSDVFITFNQQLSLVMSGSDVTCPGASDGTALATPSGGASPYAYLWSGSEVTAGISGLTAGTYTVTVTDDNGCEISDSYTVGTTPDLIPPVVNNCPANISQCGDIVTWTAPTVTENCSIINATVSHNPGSSFPVGTTTVTYSWTDVGNNTVTCVFDVTVTPTPIWYADNDGDTYGAGAAIPACIQPANTSTNNLDCNDGNAAVNPAATEICNGIDDNCDGLTDDAGGAVHNATANTFHCTIQMAIDLATAGDVINVPAGTYPENLVVNKSLSILGPNAAIDACGGTRVAEAIIVPAVSSIEYGEIIHIAASNVTISGFTIDGDNTSIATGFTSTNGADIDAAEGVTVYETGVNNLTVSNNIIQNLSYFGVTLYDYPAAVPSSGHSINNNKIQNLGTYDATSNVDYWGGGVLLYNNQYTAITNNCMTNVRLGVQTGNFHQANPGAAASQVISGNTIQARRTGIFHNLHYSNASPITMSGNTISALAHASETKWDGIALSSLSVPSFSTNNIINGNGMVYSNLTKGYEVWNVKTPLTASTITGGSVTGVDIGVFANNYDGYNSDAPDGAHATISGLTITPNATGVGIRVYDNALATSHAPVRLDVSGCIISGGLEGVKFEETQPGTVGGTFNNNNIGATAAGVNVTSMVTSPSNVFSLTNNTITIATQVAGSTPTVGVSLRKLTGTTAAVISGNNITGPFFGYLAYNLNTSPATDIDGGTITGALQGVAFLNVDPITFSAFAPSTSTVKNVSMSGFTGNYPALPNNNFHAGVYAFTTGADLAATLNVTLRDLSIDGTGKTSPASGAIVPADFSTGVGVRQTIVVDSCTLTNNLNRAISVRGKNALVDINNSTLTNNGGDPFGAGGNDGFGIIVREGSVVTVDNSFITNPSSNVGFTVSALATDLGTSPTVSLTATNNSINNNGNTSGYLARNFGGTLTATCNWWGTGNLSTIASLTTGAVTNQPMLIGGTDGDLVMEGFQPAATCETVLAVTVTGTATDETCTNLDNGAIDITAANGISPYTYLWSNASVNEDQVGLDAGTYTVTVTDAYGNSGTNSFTVNPGATPTVWYADTDNDTYGDAGSSLLACIQPVGYVADNTDCDDNDILVNPAAQEVCDGIDNDCDGLTDDADPSVIGQSTFYADVDGDGFGAGAAILACVQPINTSTNNTDCNDGDNTIYPGATEVCNGIDDDCDLAIDNGLIFLDYYVDGDSDGFGAGAATSSCNPISGSVLNNTDCNDGDNTIYPGATEVCNGIDDDCDLAIDNGLIFLDYYVDGDSDGFGAGAATSSCNPISGSVLNNTDCNDGNAAINPAAQEICDGIDNDCDGLTDDADPSVTGQLTWFADVDGDGYGDISSTQLGCVQPLNYVLDNSDCNDNASAVNPGATEVCNGIDDDCDGDTDDDDQNVVGQATWYADADGDTYGDVNVSAVSCNQPIGYVSNSTDCDDADMTINPGATESCNGVDDDCNGLTDDNLTFITYYNDFDGDGYGVGAGTSLCSNPGAGYALVDGDCNDGVAAINPGAQEICDGGIDNDCDGLADDADPSVVGQITWYADVDGDGYGDLASGILTCNQPMGSVLDNSDCNDNASAVNPGATEVCNGIDDDCDGDTDDDDQNVVGQATWYADADGDTYGDAGVSTVSCNQPVGYVSNNTDCDDADMTINPGATESCNGVDDDCNGLTDDNLIFVTYYNDFDGDGYGVGTGVSLCSNPGAGYALVDGDCNDGVAAINPGAQEICDGGIDNDCDGLADDADPSVMGQGTYYADVDGDGYGAGAGILACVQPPSTTIDNTDCNDGDNTVYPGATEVCNNIDDDCDGSTDEGLIFLTYYVDGDGDGYGAGAGTSSCVAISGSVLVDGDCNDGVAAINPAAQEICDGGIDNDCDGLADDADPSVIGQSTFYADVDGDGFGAGAGILACVQPPSTSINNTDCNDGANTVYPGAPELCNNIDDDCDGSTDEGLIFLTYYVDGDGDGYGAGAGTSSCVAISGSVLVDGDCNDGVAAINPGAQEICDGGIDNDCDGLADDADPSVIGQGTYYADVDGDGYGAGAAILACTQPVNTSTNNLDCDDLDNAIHPGAIEVCNGIDDDCDFVIDNGIIAPLGNINGPIQQCIPIANGTATFSVVPGPGVTTYSWNLPAGLTIVSGQGTPTINVSWTSAAAHDGILGPISVTPSNGCGAGPSSTGTIDLNYAAPVRPPSISGAAKVCPGDVVVYSISNVARAREYFWTVPAGVIINSGQGTNIITATITGAFAGGSIDVIGINVCGVSPSRSKTMNFNIPGVPSVISGISTGLCSVVGNAFSTAGATGATSYTWSVPTGVTIASGQGTNTITVNVSGTFTSGVLYVTGVNSCGLGTSRSITITGNPAIAGAISGPVNVCPGATGVVYQVATVAGASTYTWTVPGGVNITSGQGTKIITVDFGLSQATNQVVSVRTDNACGQSALRSLNGIAINNIYCGPRLAGENTSITEVTVFPNPATDLVTLQFNAQQETNYRLRLTDMMGRVVFVEEGTTSIGKNTQQIGLQQLSGGVYFVEIQSAEGSQSIRLIVE